MSDDSGSDNGIDNEAIAKIMKRSKWKINTSLESKRLDYERVCSICLSMEETSSNTTRGDGKFAANPLMRPCLCSGFRSRQHKLCIESWLEQTGATSCPFCLVRYDYTRKRKNFWSYVTDCELEYEFTMSLLSLSFSCYLFLIGSAVCYDYIFEKSDSGDGGGSSHFANGSNWLSLMVFCFVCTATVLLMIAIVSIGLSVALRHYIRFWLWSATHFRVEIREYSLNAPAPAANSGD